MLYHNKVRPPIHQQGSQYVNEPLISKIKIGQLVTIVKKMPQPTFQADQLVDQIFISILNNNYDTLKNIKSIVQSKADLTDFLNQYLPRTEKINNKIHISKNSVVGAGLLRCQSESLDQQITALFRFLSSDGLNIDKNDSDIREVFECMLEFVVIQIKQQTT